MAPGNGSYNAGLKNGLAVCLITSCWHGFRGLFQSLALSKGIRTWTDYYKKGHESMSIDIKRGTYEPR